ncbi:MAG: hypothetical protein IJX28_03035 [Clostridia bacterium]|nr:hypothetical protein [Clostridia bacterium]
MENRDRDYIPGQWGQAASSRGTKGRRRSSRGRFPIEAFVGVICVVIVVSVLLTYALTSAYQRSYYSAKLEKQQEKIEDLEQKLAVSGIDPSVDFAKLKVLAQIYEQYSYYAGQKTEEELMTAVLKAYAEATGDLYAEYYTKEEYAQMTAENQGDSQGIGVSVIQTTLNVNGYEYPVFQVIAIYQNAPAQNSELRIGDYVYCIKVDGVYQTVSALGGYTSAINCIRGEKGTLCEFAVFRAKDAGYESIEIGIVRDSFETVSVTGYVSEADPTIGVVSISSFDLTTPKQFKAAVTSLLNQSVEHFVFDVRYNPGGDLQSIKAVLTYFLRPGDLILSAIDKNGAVATSYYAEATNMSGSYASCNVSPAEVGMFANLDMVVLCNGSTASAAEVFTATLRDYGLATVVGETTFGKGIMQSFIPLSWFGNYDGYAKMTTYAYVTQCGITYHDIGIQPAVEVALSEEALSYNFYVLPQALDNQLQTAFAQFQS